MPTGKTARNEKAVVHTKIKEAVQTTVIALKSRCTLITGHTVHHGTISRSQEVSHDKLGYLQEHLHTVGQRGGPTPLEMVMVLVYIHRCHSLCLEERKAM